MSYCIRCYQDKPLSEMKSEKICLLCATKRRQYYKRNSDKLKKKSKANYKKNRERRLDWQKQYYKDNTEERKQYNEKYYESNKEQIIKNVIRYTKKRKLSDPLFKLRKRISADIWRTLKINKSSKNNSILKFLPYSIQELKVHLEKQFEPWMNWKNWGPYNKNSWDDNDSDTWTWQIDHITPHSAFQYSSMEDEEFQQCWSLNNLRPLSSKANIKKGNRY